ncbi:Short chain dehydrogenase [Desulfurella amilsii]|uniref:Short chain dehydrogenase n=1 Tax=Desulfurella amilsii TaxID=1562698 RepID=A0A1X4XUP3_9BACT|nr:SDR family NAD(P)-dependent oxidoreductase [Desulfurella amilsii]OSS41228.1 Short chain dehydrogenase [Desulfurella amilsii]
MYQSDLKGKIALVSGGYRGIGETACSAFAKAGINVAIAARNYNLCKQKTDSLKSDYGIETLALQMDVSDTESVKNGVNKVKETLGRIDILVNAAGISGVQKPAVELIESEFDEVFNVDFKGTFFVCKETAKLMIAQNAGKIINIASILGKIATPYMTGYCASKAAVIHFSKVLALELIKHNIQVNVICPGYFLTDINKAFFETQKGKQYINERIPIKRLGNVEELESTFLYLAAAPAFLTGTEIIIDGAQTII